MPDTPRTRAPRLSYADRHQLLLDTAFELLESGGSDALRMNALARAAGVTRPVVYEHFSNREGLLVALIEAHGRRLRGEAISAGPDSGDPDSGDPDSGDPDSGDFETDLRALVRAYLPAVKRHGVALRSLTSSVGISPVVERARSRVWDAAIGRWASRYSHDFGVDPADARALAEFHLQGLWALAGRYAVGEFTAQHLEDLHTRVVLASLNAFSPQTSTPDLLPPG